MSPGGTAAISMPSDPNFMCSGLVTVAPFFGSTKNTRGFLAAAFAAGLAASCAAATNPNPATRMRTGSTIFISDLLCHDCGGRQRDILASKPSAAPLLQRAGRRLEGEDARGDRARKRVVGRQRHDRRAPR